MLQLSSERKLKMTGAFSWNIGKLFSELKLVADNFPLNLCRCQLRSYWKALILMDSLSHNILRHTLVHTHPHRLYDSVEVMELVKKWVGFYKSYRDILISDIVHVRRPDMQGKRSNQLMDSSVGSWIAQMVWARTLPCSLRLYTLPLFFFNIYTCIVHTCGSVFSMRADGARVWLS